MRQQNVIAAVARKAKGPFSIESLILSGPSPDEVLVKIEGVGLCHTDLVVKDSAFPPALPAVLGHEGAGVVEAVGENIDDVKVGDRVILSFASCGACSACRDHTPGYCDQAAALNYAGARLNGKSALGGEQGAVASHFFGQSSFATHAVVYANNIVKAPDDAPLALLGPFGCSIQTGAGTVLNVMRPPAGAAILIAGAGAVGLSAVMAAALAGCAPIIVSDPMHERRTAAIDFGATHSHDPNEAPLREAVTSFAKGGVNFAIDTTGRREVIEAGVDALSKRGVLACLGIAPDEAPTFDVPINHLMGYGRRIVGVIEGDSDPRQLIPMLLDHYRAGRFPFDKMIKTYSLENINEAVRDQAAGRCVKPVLLPPSDLANARSHSDPAP